jgi:hypothetical protein
MHDREFEKQVQQKMQELRLAPGADVWARVEADMQKKKRRRPVLLWLLFAGLLIGSSWFLYTGLLSNDRQTAQSKPEDGNGQADPAKESKQNKSIAPVIEKAQQSTETPDNNKSATTPIINNKTTGNDITSTQHNTQNNSDAFRKTQPIQQHRKNSVTKEKPENISHTGIARKSAAGNKQTGNIIGPALQTSTQPTSTAETTSERDVQSHAVTAALLRSFPQTGIIPGPQVNNMPEINQPGIPKKFQAKTTKNRNWQWGVNTGVGMSDLGDELFKSTTVADLAYSGGGSVASPGPPFNVPRRPSEAEAGLAYQVGGYASKGISNKLRLKLGLNYEHYSNSIMVGSHVNNERFVNQGASLSVVRDYYTSGNFNKYTNKYHFVSLPVSVQWEITNHRKYGLVWENGISVAQLVNTTALIYDGISGSYYKDDNVFNKTQWAASSSLLFSVRMKGNLQLYAGPHVQYHFSNLVNNNTEHEQHLRYAGVKMIIGFNKK